MKTPPRSEYLAEFIMPHDPKSKYCTYAIKNEIVGHQVKKSGDLYWLKKFPKMQPLSRRFVLAISDEGASNEILKARFVVQQNKDSMKASHVHIISVTRQHSTRIILCPAQKR